MEQILPLVIQLISGAAGGNIVGTALKKLSLGPLGNSIAGILGGGLGGQLLGMLGLGTPGSEALDLNTILTQIGSGGAGGGVLMAIIGIIRSVLAKK